ncbi:MAG TPA: Mur ligase family protein, partial [Spirochaetota bacterium]|nr:Mur ligase family protein [Spirochaetota bacterium]
EMGADHKGEIDLLCKLVDIDYGILTSIGLQHLETFGNIDNIVETKFAILKNIPEKNFGVYNYDSELIIERLSQYKAKANLYCYSIVEKSFEKVSIYAENIKHTRKGLEFDAFLWDGDVYNVKTTLLGRHNASNLLAAILTAKLIGLSKDEICRGVDKIVPVEHRLQLIDNNNGILVLDDAFNANLSGATEALRVLNEIEGGKKIVVTPGLIDLGDKEEEHNKIFGERICKYCDVAILVGKMKTKKIQESLLKSGFLKNNMYVVNSLEESKSILAKIVKIGDVILFENDLPDAFSENN